MQNIKKYGVILTVLLMLFGCANQVENTKAIEINHEQLMQGDFSSIAGEYVNPDGDVIYLDSDGLDEGQTGTEVKYSNGKYSMNIYDSEGYGHFIWIYDIGTDVSYSYGDNDFKNIETDTSKVRIYFGQSHPISNKVIYTKKEE